MLLGLFLAIVIPILMYCSYKTGYDNGVIDTELKEINERVDKIVKMMTEN